MCTKPLSINGYEVSCLECDQCAATYKNTWVTRCVAEKQTMPYAYAVTLTYADVDGEPPLGARVFRYKDVSDMWKRIRAAAKRRWKENLDMRYVIVGERGTKFGRCHYHGVIFASRPIEELGTFTSASGDGFAYKRRLDWTIWGHGYVDFQMADRDGMAYVLKYILKARMTARRSEGFGREGKTEWLASSYLWCSKRPAVGAYWLWNKLNDLVDRGMCPPSLRMRVPGGGDWYVSGPMQKAMCLFLHEANEQYREERGRDLAGWRTLINSVAEPIELADTGEVVARKPWEWLTNGEENETEAETTPEQAERERQAFNDWYAEKRRLAGPITTARATVRKCGNIRPCEGCARFLSGAESDSIESEYQRQFDGWVKAGFAGRNPEYRDDLEGEFREWWQTRLRPSRGCGNRDAAVLRDQFKRLVAVTKSQPGLAGKAAIGKAL